MAGRVERRINNKFYFVLDEVGGSSDCESELASDNDDRATGRLNLKGNIAAGVDAEDTCASRNDIAVNTTKTNCPDSMDITDSKNNDADTSQGSDSVQDNVIEYEKVKAFTSDNDKDRTFKNPNNVFSSSEDTSAVVDMDIDSDLDCTEQHNKPLIKVTFRDDKVEELLKASLFKFFSQKIKDCTIITNSENNLELEIYDKDPKNLLKEDLLDFDLDTTPGDDNSDVPFYGKPHDHVLSDKILEKPQAGKLYASSCFNCLGNHNLRDCPKVKNFRIINKNRLKFQTQNKMGKSSRYHLDENQKFSHILPGVISKKLRNALNLRRDQQPQFIYRMRLLGYPPAWLEEAKVSHSGVVMYNSIGAPVLEEDEEEGEILPEGSKDRFDITKIIEFPGFNVPLPNNFKDESKMYHCPVQSTDQSKENLIKQLEPKTVQAYVKKSLTSQKSEEKVPSQDEEVVKVKKMPSPTIEEMEEKKRQLLMQLNDEDSASDTKPNSEDSSAGPAAPEPEPVQNAQNRELGTVKNLEFGTPILKSVSPFSKLPSREQFSVNVSDVINFENLPNSTGKYETMRNVITKIRVSTSKSET